MCKGVLQCSQASGYRPNQPGCWIMHDYNLWFDHCKHCSKQNWITFSDKHSFSFFCVCVCVFLFLSSFFCVGASSQVDCTHNVVNLHLYCQLSSSPHRSISVSPLMVKVSVPSSEVWPAHITSSPTDHQVPEWCMDTPHTHTHTQYTPPTQHHILAAPVSPALIFIMMNLFTQFVCVHVYLHPGVCVRERDFYHESII